ncbi:TPA: hypothetical protein ACH3X1_001253 [Trebouxia sp. C0004]
MRPSAVDMLPLLCNDSAAFAAKLLKVIKSTHFNAQDIPWNTAEELHAFLDEQQVWEHKPVHTEVVPKDSEPSIFHAYLRRDPDLLLQEMINSPGANGMCLVSRPVTSGGRRVYTDFASGEWLEGMQASL